MIAALATLVVLGLGRAPASAQDWRPPTETERCPSGWGAGDERGSANLMTPEIVLRAARLILVANGIYLIESLKLDELVEKRLHEFAFIAQPLKLRGATGSSVAPVAVR